MKSQAKKDTAWLKRHRPAGESLKAFARRTAATGCKRAGGWLARKGIR